MGKAQPPMVCAVACVNFPALMACGDVMARSRRPHDRDFVFRGGLATFGEAKAVGDRMLRVLAPTPWVAATPWHVACGEPLACGDVLTTLIMSRCACMYRPLACTLEL